jgi:ribonucleoside-diphosphate reductase alpha chain
MLGSLPPISHQVWDLKYRLKDADGRPLDRDITATFARVASAAAQAEVPDARARWAAEFEAAMTGFKFLPAGRILAGAGAKRRVTLFNCFVMGEIPDSMDGIFQHLKEAALTMQQGGGIGYDFSTLRPKGAAVEGVGADASGPLSFMDVWDAMCRTIMSAGHRRGAMMGCMAIDHPDIEAFITAKTDPKRLRMFNLSVLVSDAFMTAVAADKPWDLTFAGRVLKTVSARALYDRIMRATFEAAEPGVIFIDRVNQENALSYCETIRATNPCGEQPLPPYGACLLGSINLAALIEHPFTDGVALDEVELVRLTATAVRFLDDVIEISQFPLTAQAGEAKAKRRIGLGVTGLADAMALVRVRYGSPESLLLTDRWLQILQAAAYRASAALAAEKGAFPLFDRERYLAHRRIAALPQDIRDGIAAHGLRNGLLTSIAPTGTISLFAGNVSSGIEPIFAYRTRRRLLMANGEEAFEEVEDFAHRLYREQLGPDRPLPDYFVTSEALPPSDHVAIQAAAQGHIDSAISKTINCPADISFEAFKTIYQDAYAKGCKGLTTYRPNLVTGAVLAPAAPASTPALAPPRGDIVYMHEPLDRPETLPGETYKVRWPESDHAIYITLNDIVLGGRRRPFEIFINSKNMEHYAWTVALTRMISAVFRRGGDVSFVVDELKAVFDPRGGHWMNGRYVPSLLAAIGDVIEIHMRAIGFLAPKETPADGESARQALAAGASLGGGAVSSSTGRSAPGRPCPRCGQPELVAQEGCLTCLACGYSKCA